MTFRSFFSLTAALFGLSLALTSCVRWNIGDRIRQSTETRTGVDITRPVDGVIYNGRYVCAHEVTYRPKSRWVYGGLHERPAAATKVKRTGRIVIAEIEPAKDKEPARFVRSVRSLPAGAVPATFYRRPPLTEASLGTTVCNHGENGKWIQMAAAPFYVIDPALNVLSTPFYWAYVGIKTLVTGEDPQWEIPAPIRKRH